jgi:hypothetical protein
MLSNPDAALVNIPDVILAAGITREATQREQSHCSLGTALLDLVRPQQVAEEAIAVGACRSATQGRGYARFR